MTITPRTLNLLTWSVVLPAFVALALLLVAGPGYRLDLWHFGTSFSLMRYSAYIGLAAAVLAVIVATLRLRQRRPIFWCLLALVVGLVTVWVPWQQLRVARSVPAIHDITTDPDDPPAFVAVRDVRPADANPIDYAGEALAAQQRAAYPDVVPLELSMPPRDAWTRVVATARELGWEIVAEDPTTGRLEATATTFWFGFEDDVVVRIRPLDAGGSRIDVRSISRIGKSDLGANAKRIRAFLAAVQKA